MLHRLARLWILPALVCLPAQADVLMPGTRSVRHELVVESSPALQGVTLVATPLHGFRAGDPIVPGQPFPFSTKYGTRLYAFAPGVAIPQDREALEASALASTDLPVIEETAVPLVSPVTRVLTRLRVTAILERRIELEILGEERLDASGRPAASLLRLTLLGAIAAAGLLGVLLLRRRRRKAPAS